MIEWFNQCPKEPPVSQLDTAPASSAPRCTPSLRSVQSGAHALRAADDALRALPPPRAVVRPLHSPPAMSTPHAPRSSRYARVRAARRALATIVAVSAGAGFLLAAGLARADEAVAALPALPPPAPAPAASCTLADHAGVEDADARTAADLVCHDLAERGARGAHAVRFGKLGARLVVTVRAEGGEERRVILSSIDEVTVASPRLAAAIVEGKPLDETQTVNNVLREEARPVVSKPGQMGFNGGLFGVSPGGQGTSPSPGVDLGLLYQAGRFGVGAAGRLAPAVGDGPAVLSYVVLGTGGRFYLGEGDVSPFVGSGVTYASLCVKDRSGAMAEGEVCGTGFGGYGELGVEALRTHRVAFAATARADVPFFALHGSDYSYATRSTTTTTRYAVPVSVMVGMLFH